MINTDGAGCYGPAIDALKKEGRLPKDVRHRQVQHLGNILEADHGKLKRLIKPTRGFHSIRTAYATIKGFEVMRALKKGQGAIFRFLPGVAGEAHLAHRNFGPCRPATGASAAHDPPEAGVCNGGLVAAYLAWSVMRTSPGHASSG